MIPFAFEYYRPASAQEAVFLYHSLLSREKSPMYYAGGTEIISFARLYQLYPRAVIDMKAIPECNTLEFQGDQLIIGAAKTLSQVQESGLFPLLSQCGGRVADHTVRNKITVGGNVCSRLPFREAILALLVSDCEVVIAGTRGIRQEPMERIYKQSLQLEPGDLLLQFSVDRHNASLPFYSMKKTANGDVAYPQDKIGYPLISAALVKKNGQLRAAFSGLCPFPFRAYDLEEILNHSTLTVEEKLDQACKHLPAQIADNIDGSDSYREFVFRQTLSKALDQLEGA